MKKFHQNYLGRSNKGEKKERKIKKHHSEEICKCVAPFVKMHWHDCPLMNKSCPIHGNRFDLIEKEENSKPIQNMTVSFYPSLKTERIFQPIKSLLTHCNPETKINFQYYSQGNLTNKRSTKDRFIQTDSEEFKRALSNVFEEKIKSFITNKTNKMNKLKQCFHSPCDSITRRSLSQTSIREMKDEIPFEKGQHRNIFLNRTLEEPLNDVMCDSSFEWFSPRKLDFENLVKLSDEKKNSDFITFTKRSNNSVIDHKIFEIKHKKGLNDISADKFPKQSTQLVYSAYNIGHSNKALKHSKGSKKTSAAKKSPVKTEKMREKKKDETSSTSGKSHSSSSGSVYVTPFFLMPTADEDRGDLEMIDQGTNTEPEPVRVKDSAAEKFSTISEGKQTNFQESEQMQFPLSEKPQLNSVSLQTELLAEEKRSPISRESFLRNYEPSEETLKNKFKDYDATATRDDFSDEIYWKRKCSEASRGENNTNNHLKTAKVLTSNNHGNEELFVTDFYGESIREKASQTEPKTSEEASCKMFESEADNAQMTYSANSTKGTQTSFSESLSYDFSNLTDFQSSNITVIVRSLDEPKPELNNDQMTETCCEESCSDIELHEKKKYRCTKTDIMTPLPEICPCRRSNLRKTPDTKEAATQSTHARLSEDNPQALESNNLTDKRETISQIQKSENRLSKAEQTSLEDEYLPQALSDLSELKKIILKFFESMNFKENNKSETEEVRMINVKTDQSTMTDNKPVLSVTQKSRKMNSAETQTTVHILMDEEMGKNHSQEPKVKFRQSVLIGDENKSKTFFVCALCGRDINRFCLNASTNTDNHDNCATIKEKTTVIDTKYSKIIEVKTFKKAKNACTPKELINNSKPIPKHITFLEKEKPTKVLKSAENSPREVNFKKSCIPILITEPGPAYLKKDGTLPVTESRNLRALTQEWRECSRSTDSQIRRSPRSPAAQQLSEQCARDEIAGPSTKITSVSPNLAKAQKSRIQPKTDIFPSLPRVEHPGVETSQWRKEERSLHANSKPNYRRTDGFFYPVSIKPFWPTEVKKTRESAEKPEDSVGSTSKQKRAYDKDLGPNDIPAEKKIKAFRDESKKECFLFEKPVLSDLSKGKLEKDSESIWVPSVSSRNDYLSHYKTTKSEEFVRTSHQREGPIQVRRFGSDSANEVFTVKSCHLKPVTFMYDQQPFNNLFECSVCKSLTFMKTNKESTCYIWPNTALSYHGRIPEGKSTEKVLKESTPDSTSQYDEEFLRENLDFSDTMSLSLEEPPESNTPEEEEEVINESQPESKCLRSIPKSQSQNLNLADSSFYTDVCSTSEFLNTFRFNKDSKKYNFKKHSK